VFTGGKVSKLIPDRYLGDGVYVSYDGYNLWLDLRVQRLDIKIALEPEVLAMFDQYRRDIQTAIEKAQEEEKPTP
jgi:hypothetical protein